MKQTNKVLVASIIGSTVEWYDFFAYFGHIRTPIPVVSGQRNGNIRTA